jgi:hypothetical protein
MRTQSTTALFCTRKGGDALPECSDPGAPPDGSVRVGACAKVATPPGGLLPPAKYGCGFSVRQDRLMRLLLMAIVTLSFEG